MVFFEQPGRLFNWYLRIRHHSCWVKKLMLKETGIQIAITFNQIFPIIGVRHESFKIFFYNTSIKTLAVELYLSSHKKLGHRRPPSSYLFMTRVYSSTTRMYIKDLIFFSLINFHRHRHFNTQSEIWLFWSVN